MRITGGEFGGRRIVTPEGRGTRPTADRVREALFSILGHAGYAPALSGARVLDGFAGSGALGLEAASRGARFVLFVEEAARARAAIRANVEALGLSGRTKIWRRDITRMGRAAPMKPFGLVFLDPPYGHGLAEKALAALAAGGWLVPEALIVVEESARAGFTPPAGFAERDARTYGDTQVRFLTFTGPPAQAGGAGGSSENDSGA